MKRDRLIAVHVPKLLIFSMIFLGPLGTKCNAKPDWRNVETGYVIPDENYADQPYVAITRDGNWLCTLTTGKGTEHAKGQHIIATISRDHGKTWSKPIDIEPADGPHASWVVPLVVPSGRVYVFYDYNGDHVQVENPQLLGWYCFKYSDDHGKTWSPRRYRLPVRVTKVHRENQWQGKVQLFWGIDKPIIVGNSVYFAFSKIGKYVASKSEGWLFRSDNIVTENDPTRIRWQMLPDGDVGIRHPDLGSVQAEHNLESLANGDLYCMYRTIMGYPAHSYSRDSGHIWTQPTYATYTPGGKKMKTNRACPRVWKAANGKFLFWFHNHSGKSYPGRNPVWVSGGIEKDGFIHWSQPGILLYHPGTTILGMSYPDWIEQEGRYWVTETQKTVARVHEVEPELLQGLWSQGQTRQVVQKGMHTSLDNPKNNAKIPAPKLPSLIRGNGFTLELWIQANNLAPDQVILDSTTPAGKGIRITTQKNDAFRLEINDGTNSASCDSDPYFLKKDAWHHIVMIVDGGPKIITFVIDGVLCDGGEHRQ